MTDVYFFFDIENEAKRNNKQICKVKDSLLRTIFDIFVFGTGFYYWSLVCGYFREKVVEKKKSELKEGLLKEFNEEGLRLVSRDNRDVIK